MRKRYVWLLLALLPLAAPAQTGKKTDSTSLLYHNRQDTFHKKSQRQIADSSLRHKDTSWKSDNWVPDLDNKRPPSKRHTRQR